jgi:hypothetical protein
LQIRARRFDSGPSLHDCDIAMPIGSPSSSYRLPRPRARPGFRAALRWCTIAVSRTGPDGEMVDAGDLKSPTQGYVGSSPTPGTKRGLIVVVSFFVARGDAFVIVVVLSAWGRGSSPTPGTTWSSFLVVLRVSRVATRLTVWLLQACGGAVRVPLRAPSAV